MNKLFQPKLEAIKKYQLFTACKNKVAIVTCQSSCLTDHVMYEDDLSKTKKMTANAVQKVLSSTPDKLYPKRLGLRDIKAVGLRENYADLIDDKYHEEMCPMPPLEIWIKVKNWYPIGTKIEREFPKDSGVFYDATVIGINIFKTKRYKLKWDDDDEFLEKEDNYVGSQIGKYLSPEEMSKFQVGENIRKMFDKLWHDGRIESIDTKNKFYRVVYEDHDKEDMTMQEVRKFWVKPEAEDKSSSKKNSGPTKIIQLLVLK